MEPATDQREAEKAASPVPTDAKPSFPDAATSETAHSEQHATATTSSSPHSPSKSSAVGRPSHRWRNWLLVHGALAGLAVAGYFLYPWVVTALNTVSTDDAYVNSARDLRGPPRGRPGEQGPGGRQLPCEKG